MRTTINIDDQLIREAEAVYKAKQLFLDYDWQLLLQAWVREKGNAIWKLF